MGRDDGETPDRCTGCGEWLDEQHEVFTVPPHLCVPCLRSALDAERRAHADTRARARNERLLHPEGRCGCAGEGRCQWCLLMQTAIERDEARADVDRLTAENAALREAARRLYEVSTAVTDAGPAVVAYEQAATRLRSLAVTPDTESTPEIDTGHDPKP